MTFKTLKHYNTTTGLDIRITATIFGMNYSDISHMTNFSENAAKFRQIEFLSGSYSIYVFNNSWNWKENTNGSGSNTAIMAFKPFRTWYDDQLKPMSESQMPVPTDKFNIWTDAAEQPGVGVRFITSQSGQKNTQKMKWSFNQKSWKGLKANRTGFQTNLPLTSSNPIIPANHARINIYIDAAQDTQTAHKTVANLHAYTVHKITVRFKGRIDPPME